MVLYQILKPIATILCRALFQLEVRGEPNVPRRGAFLLASNHTSYLDPVILGVACPRPLHCLARADLFEQHALGGLVRSLGAVPIQRQRPTPGTMKETLKLLHQGQAVCLFPEGTRSPDGRPQPPKVCVGLLAVRGDVPVVPVWVDGTHRVLPRGGSGLRLEQIRVAFGKPLRYETSPLSQDHRAVAEDVMRAVTALAAPRTAEPLVPASRP
jgi:1-acyl-sn-glycerol-3-phosphate acyltransferase